MAGIDPASAFAVSSYLYIACFMGMVIMLIFWFKRRRKRRQVLAMLSFVTASITLRIVWLYMKMASASPVVAHLVNRLCFLLYFTGFFIYVLTWAAAASNFRGAVPRSFFRVGVAVNVILYGAILGSSLAVLLLGVADDTESLVYDANIVTVVVSFSLLSAVFCGVGARLHRRLRIMTIALKKNRGPALFRMQVASNKVALASIVCTVCFAIRTFVFLWRPITGRKHFPSWLEYFAYPYLFYTFVELAPAVTIALLLAPSRESRDKTGSRSHMSSGHSTSVTRTNRSRGGSRRGEVRAGRTSGQKAGAGAVDGAAIVGVATDAGTTDVLNPIMQRGAGVV